MACTAYITHPDCLLHEMGPQHPERPDRIRAIAARLESTGLLGEITSHEAPLANSEDLKIVHDPKMIEGLRDLAPKSGRAMIDADTSMNPHSWQAALRAAGAAQKAIELVFSGQAKSVFCNIRPPGHHAEHARAMGFCLFNNVAFAAKLALERHGLSRVAIIDFDVHHGNGTEDIFKDDARVMLCSSFQHPQYPYSPLEQIGANANVIKSPLAYGEGGDDLKKIVNEIWWPRWEDFKPELVLVSAGFDAHQDDPIGGLKFVESDYAWITGEIVALAKKFAEGRIVSCLEGGYDLNALAASAAAHVAGLIKIGQF